MKLFGYFTRKEWFLFWTGFSIEGMILGALFHDLFILLFNAASLAFNLYMLGGLEDDNG